MVDISFELEQQLIHPADVHRQSLLALLKRYLSRYPDEIDVVGQYAAFVKLEPSCFNRETEEGHVTAAVWLVDHSGMNVLLTHHRKLNKWLQLGGHADGNGNVHAVALEEAREESGIAVVSLLETELFDVDIHAIPARSSDPEHLHYDVRFIAQTDTTDYVVSSESHDLAWVRINQIRAYTQEPSMLRMADKWLRRSGG